MIKLFLNFLLSSFKSRQALAMENIAIRHQLEALQRNAKRPRLKPNDRAFWAVLSRLLPSWQQHLTIVQPDTVIRWHRAGWRLYWRWKSKPGPGRPKVPLEVRTLIRQMSLDRRKIIHFNVTTNPTSDWTSLQLIQAFPFDTAPRFLIRDRDGIYGQHVIEYVGEAAVNWESDRKNGCTHNLCTPTLSSELFRL